MNREGCLSHNRTRRFLRPVLLGLGVVGGPLACAQSTEFLPVEEAFVINAVNVPGTGIRFDWRIREGHYLYRDKTMIDVGADAGALFEPPQISAGIDTDDPYFGPVSIWRHRSHVSLAFAASNPVRRTVPVSVTYQGCAEAGLCYPPVTTTFDIEVPAMPGPRAEVPQVKVLLSAQDSVNDAAEQAPTLGIASFSWVLAGAAAALLLLITRHFWKGVSS